MAGPSSPRFRVEGLQGGGLRAELTRQADDWLASLYAAAVESAGFGESDAALVAVGSLGRREFTPRSDLDLILVHAGRGSGIAAVADRIWYPIWDAGIALDHSVRMVTEAAQVARADLRAAMGQLDTRHLAGSQTLSEALRQRLLADWRAQAPGRLPELAAACRERAERHGELAFLLEPDLKESRGGLRDALVLEHLAAAQLTDRPAGPVRAATELLLDVRGALPAGQRSDVLRLQDQDAIAGLLDRRDADDLMSGVAAAGRLIAYALDTTLRRVTPVPGRRRLPGVRRAGNDRRPLADGVVSQAGEVVLALDADPAEDPVLVLRVAGAAAREGLPIAPGALQRLASAAPMPQPWPAAAREALVELLAVGHAAVPVLEELDQHDLLVRLLPEWAAVRSKPQRNAFHRFTVDRHLLETAANAAALTRRVSRPDLLLLAALLHDIGKGGPGDHTDAGVRLVGQIGPRLGLSPQDTATLIRLVRHHLLLADTAQRRDLDDPATIASVAEAVGDQETLELLLALTEADSIATGPSMWSSWKARLLASLGSRVAAVLGGSPPAPAALSPRQSELLAGRALALVAEGEEIDAVLPDQPGLIATVAGVLALHRLEIRSLTARVGAGWALLAAVAHPRFGTGPDWALVRADLARWLAVTPESAEPAALTALVCERASHYPPPRHAAAPAVRWIEAAVSAPVLEVRAPDGLGVLHQIAAAITTAGAEVLSARCQTLGADVVDTFTVAPLDAARRLEVAAGVLAALGVPSVDAPAAGVAPGAVD